MMTYAKPENVPEYQAEYAKGTGWRVVNRKGEVSTEVFASKNAAQTAARMRNAAFNKDKKKIERPCLCCGTKFMSAGIGNRLCNRCRAAGTAEAMPAGYSFGAMTGRRKSS